MKKLTLFTIMLAGFFASSCEKYLDINYDPSNPQAAESAALMPPILAQMVRGEAFDSRFVGQYIQNWASSGAGNVWDLHGYAPGSDAGGEKWRSHYWSIGKNVDLIIEDAVKGGKWDYSGAAKAIRAWSWQSTTDYHGEMILKEAWEPNRYVFDFDSQEDVYKEVERLCRDALKDLARTDGSVSTASLGRGDLVYKGDRTLWIKFVYSVLARNYHHISNKAGYNPDSVIAFVDKSFVGNSENFNVPHAGTNSLDGNFFGPLRNNMGGYRQTVFALSLLDGTVFGGVKDPRLPLLYTACPDGIFRGIVPGQSDPNSSTGNVRRIPTLWGVQPEATSTTPTYLGKYIYTDKAGHPMITYAELQFIKAEAAFKKGNLALAYEAYIKGVSAHLDFAGVLAANKTTYLTSAAVVQSAGALTLKDIMLQKYIALIGHGCLETWVDMRRYQYSTAIYPNFTLPSPLYPDNGSKPAQRVRPRYNSEYVWNRESLNKVGGNNLDYHTYEVWFSKAQ